MNANAKSDAPLVIREHTPGPWEAIDLAVWHSGSVVAQCHWISGQITGEAAAANARLIAAAPDLHFTLRLIANVTTDEAARELARGALERAETGAQNTSNAEQQGT